MLKLSLWLSLFQSMHRICPCQSPLYTLSLIFSPSIYLLWTLNLRLHSFLLHLLSDLLFVAFIFTDQAADSGVAFLKLIGDTMTRIDLFPWTF